MKKFFVSMTFLLVFGAYSAYQYFNTAGQVTHAGNTVPTTSNPTTSVSTPTPVSTTPNPTPTPVVAVKPQGQYIDGAYTGSVADAYWGNVQVQVSIAGGKIADVQFLQYPNSHSTSSFINNQAMPLLKSEAIQAQSDQVDGVSGATDTSAAFQQSLASALTQAKA